MFIRFLRFNFVGALGIGVQLAAVTLLVGVLGLHYLVASALAIEMAVLHNFAWHERWTWRDRRLRSGAPADQKAEVRIQNTEDVTCHSHGHSVSCLLSPVFVTPPPSGSVFFRCLAFHAGNGCVSLLGSLALLPFLVGSLHLHYFVANLVTISATGVLNFLVSDRLVFAPR